MNERRAYFRVQAPARVSLRRLAAGEEPIVRARIRARYLPGAFAPGALDEARLPVEHRLTLELLRHIALSLERVEKRLSDLEPGTSSGPDALAGRGQPVEISLSGSGFAGPFELELDPGERIEAEIDLLEAGVPLLRVLVEPVRGLDDEEADGHVAFCFDEIHPEDRERIVQLAMRLESRTRRMEEPEEER